MRRLKKLGLKCWIEPGGKVGACYFGKNPLVLKRVDNWKTHNQWKHKHWWLLEPTKHNAPKLYSWATYMEDRICAVLNLDPAETTITWRGLTNAKKVSDIVFVIDVECIQ